MRKQKISPQTFSQYFKLNKPQEELEFLDIYANQDIPLFLDPYGISAMGSNWGKECESQIATYFQCLIDNIARRDKKSVKKLLDALHEVNEVSLGCSATRPEGRGIGSKQAAQIQKAFENSEAAKSGDIKDIADCALLIAGINRDKISDITANILKRELISFTQKQCKLHSIPVKKVAVNNAFDYNTLAFTSYYTDLPVVNGRAKILLPLSSVRQDPELSKDKYYRNFVLEYLKAEHSHAGDALATVLKNGKIKVRISDLKRKYPNDTNLLYKFSKEHPEVLKKYKSELRRTANKKSTPKLATKNKALTAKERIDILNNIKSGKLNATDYHKLIFDTLIYVFGKRLSNPISEARINDGRKRIDIKFNNKGNWGFFHDLNTLHHIKCPKIFIECKNYEHEVGNPELDQLLGRFSNHRGNFGMLVCRSIKNKKKMIQRCRDILHDRESFIVILEDIDIKQLIIFREEHKEDEIDNYLTSKLDEIIM